MNRGERRRRSVILSKQEMLQAEYFGKRDFANEVVKACRKWGPVFVSGVIGSVMAHVERTIQVTGELEPALEALEVPEGVSKC